MKVSEAGSDRHTIAVRFFSQERTFVRNGGWMKVDREIFNSCAEVAIQDLLMDVAAVVDATEPERVWDATIPGKPNVVCVGNLRPGGRYGQRRE
ncbi:MAG TPA: hypothetical protein VN881_07225 [Candidatus Acidoferrales bacterium]|jgi:hypothetical protein|nr:hypothetical protein [Candidatus Acidoferrales bacterium]